MVGRGFTVVMPHLFGKVPERRTRRWRSLGSLRQACVNREFNKLRLHQTSPIADWLRSLARDLHAELGGPGVGALGMCFTGGFALAMMVDDSVAAPVLAQPSLPFPVGKARARRPQPLPRRPREGQGARRRAAARCSACATATTWPSAPASTRSPREIGDAFIRVEFPGRKHSTLTAHRQQEGVDRVLAFFREKLLSPSEDQPAGRDAGAGGHQHVRGRRRPG